MPNEKYAVHTPSILFRPHEARPRPAVREPGRAKLVEAPGTAPGSAALIPQIRLAP